MQQQQKTLDDQKSTAEHDALIERNDLEQQRKDFESQKSSAEHDASMAKDDLEQQRKEFESQKSSAEHDALVAKNDLEQRREEFESQKRSSANNSKACTRKHASDGSDDLVDKAAVEKKQHENAKLEQRLAKLENQLSSMSEISAADKKKSMPNGSAKGSAANGVSLPGCGYKHYKPPRKLNRKLIGMVYE
jgi:hypothetical protein